MGGGVGTYAALQTTLLYMNRLNKIESQIVVLLCVLRCKRHFLFLFNCLFDFNAVGVRPLNCRIRDVGI